MKKVKDLISEELRGFYQRYLSFRAFKTTDRATDSYGVNNRNATSSVANNSVGTSQLQANAVTQAKLASSSVGQNQLRYEQVGITISGASTSGTATVTSGSIPIGYFLSAFTTPAASYVQLAVSGTTLTATLSTAPGVGNSVTIQTILLKT